VIRQVRFYTMYMEGTPDSWVTVNISDAIARIRTPTGDETDTVWINIVLKTNTVCHIFNSISAFFFYNCRSVLRLIGEVGHTLTCTQSMNEPVRIYRAEHWTNLHFFTLRARTRDNISLSSLDRFAQQYISNRYTDRFQIIYNVHRAVLGRIDARFFFSSLISIKDFLKIGLLHGI
jgi:hypothetical protein